MKLIGEHRKEIVLRAIGLGQPFGVLQRLVIQSTLLGKVGVGAEPADFLALVVPDRRNSGKELSKLKFLSPEWERHVKWIASGVDPRHRYSIVGSLSQSSFVTPAHTYHPGGVPSLHTLCW